MTTWIEEELQWCDRKRYYGLPLSFEIYSVTRDRLSLSSGFFQQSGRDIMLYRIRDISVTCTLAQRFFGVGTVSVVTADNENVLLENIRDPYLVKELLHENIEEQRQARRFGCGGYRFCEPGYYPWSPDWA